MSSSPRVSIIIPTLGSNTLLSALESLWKQTFDDFEVIIVDSTPDDSIAKLVGGIDPRLRYMQSRKRGVSYARNDGVFNARGELIALLDSDDVWYPHHLATQVDSIDSTPNVGLAFANVLVEEETGTMRSYAEWSRFLAEWVQEYTTSDTQEELVADIYQTLISDQVIHTSSVVMKKSVFEEHGGFDEGIKICEDWDLWLRILRDRPVVYNTKISGEYRFNKNGLSGDDDNRYATWNMYKVEILCKHLEMNLVRNDCCERFKSTRYRRFAKGAIEAIENNDVGAVQRLCAAINDHHPEAAALALAVAGIPHEHRSKMKLLLAEGFIALSTGMNF